MKKLVSTCVNSLLLVGSGLYAASPVDKGPIHEAFVQQIDGGIVLSAVAKAPPKDVAEQAPEQTDPQSEWIGGYWAWDDTDNTYVWMSGVWRRPPPNHKWISGYWKKYGKGHVWIRGFWSATDEEDLEYIGDPPPDPIEEEPGNPMGSQFWMSGYWSYNDASRSYAWVKGSWAALDPDWVLVPAHYEWRPEGYVFVPAYWDWPIEYRGTAYSPVKARAGEDYTPSEVLESTTIVRRLVAYYPNYLCFYQHHYYYHWHWWIGWWGTPPWWGWFNWWGFGWHAHWGLWWWFGHPGFPHPFWLTAAMAAQMWPPGGALLALLQNLWGLPLIITPHGIVPINALRNAIGRRALPILPADRRRRRDILDRVEPAEPSEQPLRPSADPGSGRDQRGTPGPRPDFGPTPRDIDQLPPVAPPRLPGRRPPIQPEAVPPPRPDVQPTPTMPMQPTRPTRPVQPTYPPRQVQPRPVRPYPRQPEYQPRPRPGPGRAPRPSRPRERPHPTRPVPPRRGPSEIGPYRPGPTQTRPPSRGPSEIGPRQTAPQPSRPPRQIQPYRPQQIQPQRIQPQRMQPQRIQPQRTQPQRIQPQRMQPQRIQPMRTQPQRMQPQRTSPGPSRPAPSQRGFY